jgi:hypothetical protein
MERVRKVVTRLATRPPLAVSTVIDCVWQLAKTIRLLTYRTRFGNYPLLPHLLKVPFGVLLEDVGAVRAAEINPLALVVRIDIFVDLAAPDRADDL